MHERVVDREQVRLQRRLPVHVEEDAPELACGDRAVGDRLDHVDVADRRTALELRVDAVERVTGGLPVQVDHDDVLLAAALAPLGRVGEVARLPPRVGALEHPRRAQADAIVDRRDHVLGLVEGDETGDGALVRRLPEAGKAGRQRHLAGERGEPVAEAPVDDLLRRPQGRDRLAAVADVLELRAHHRGEDPAAAVGRQDADDGDAAAAHGAARDGQLEREGAGPADDAVAVERRVHPLEGQVAGEPLRRLVVGRPAAEVVADRPDGALELLQIARGTDVPRHQKTSGQYGGRSVRKSSVAASAVPSRRSCARPERTRRWKSKAPR